MIIKYFKKSISILSKNGEKIKLGEGGIKLGTHQISLKFILEDFPKVTSGLKVMIDSFSENANQINILRLLINGEKRKYFLKKTNDFSTNILFETIASQCKENKSFLLELLFFLLKYSSTIFRPEKNNFLSKQFTLFKNTHMAFVNMFMRRFFSHLIFLNYFPIQKLAKIFPNKSSVEISPVILPR